MSPDSDAELLRQFAENEDQDAFAALVARHIDLVYSTALRQLAGDAHLSKDVTQSVFTDLARKARALALHRVLSSWLYLSTCYAAAKFVRAEQRRKRREAAAHAMQDLLHCSGRDDEWNRLRPVLDETLRELRADDRDAILLRFFENCPYPEMGARLRLTENAARMRVDRALEKLRVRLERIGITSTAAALSSVLAAQAVYSAPAALAGSVTTAALATAASAGSLGIVSWFAAQKIAAVSAVALLSAAVAGLSHERQKQAELRGQRDALETAPIEAAALREGIDSLRRDALEVAALRKDDAELERLSREAAALQSRIHGMPPKRGAKELASHESRPDIPNTIYDVRELDQPPRIKSQTPPSFPFDLRGAGVSGEVLLCFVVNKDGKVTAAQVLSASHRAFEMAAMTALRSWTFNPGTKNGAPVATKMVVPMVFTLNSPDPKWF